MDEFIEIFCQTCDWSTKTTAGTQECILSDDAEQFPIPIGFTYICPKCITAHTRCLYCPFTSGKADKNTRSNLRRHSQDCLGHITHPQEADEDEFQDTSIDFGDFESTVNMSIDVDTNNVVDDGSTDDDTSSLSFDQFQMIFDDDDDDTDEEEYSDDDNSETFCTKFDQHEIFEIFQKIYGDDLSCALYFYLNHQTKDDGNIVPGGVRGLVRRSRKQVKFSLEMSEAELAGFYFDLMLKLQKETDEEKEVSLRLIIGQLRLTHSPGANIPELPTSIEDINTYILAKRCSMLRNFPTEGLIDVDEIHACSSIEKLIDIMMGQGIRPDFAQNEYGVRNRSGINGTPAADFLVNDLRAYAISHNVDPDAVAIGWISIWSDSFLSSWIKQKLNSVWVLTITVSNPFGSRSDQHTFVVAIGPSQVNHEDVVASVIQQIKDLRKPKLRFCGHTNQFILTSFDVIAYLSDTPERCHLTFTSLMGEWGKRFNWAGIADRDYLPSCPNCFKERVRNSILGLSKSSNSNCTNCCDWDYSNSENAAWKQSSSLDRVFRSHEKGPNAYPTSNVSSFEAEGRVIPETSHLRPKKQTFNWFLDACKISFYMYAAGLWFKYAFDSFLRTFGINAAARERCFAAAKTAREEIKGKTEEEKQSELKKMLEQPNALQEKNIIPSIWASGINLYQFPVVPMHLLFTGVTSDVLLLVQRVMARARKKNKFNEKFTTDILSDLVKYRLEWIKCKQLPATQYASENFIAIARLFPFLMGFYFYKLDPYGNGVTGQHIQLLSQLANSFSVMISALMRVDKDVTSQWLDQTIKIFLSCLHDCENGFQSFSAPDSTEKKTKKKKDRDDKQYSGIFEKSNFLSLLNIPDQFDFFGPLRLLWEGNCEFFISGIKSIVDHVRMSLKFFQRKLRIYQERFWLSHVNVKMSSKYRTTEVDWTGGGRYYRYKTYDSVQKGIENGTTISFIKFKGKRNLFVAVGRVRGNSSQDFVEITRDIPQQNVTQICGALYCHFHIVKNIDGSPKLMKVKKEHLSEKLVASECGLLLSFGSGYGHTIITEHWKVMDERGDLTFPCHSDGVFRDQLI